MIGAGYEKDILVVHFEEVEETQYSEKWTSFQKPTFPYTGALSRI
jgi:hypothetical protein